VWVIGVSAISDEADKICDIYEKHAQDWDRNRGRSLFERPWLDRFIGLLPNGGSILDMGCGSAEPLARYLIERGLRVTGVDASPAMIAKAEARFPESRWIVADMRTLSLQRRYDGLLAWDSFFHLRPDDQRGLFRIFAAHANPGTALMFTSGPSEGHVIGDFYGEALYHASLSAAEYRSLLNDHGFSVVTHVIEDSECGGHTVWLARRR
jgi:SAM-dependent methyltransferase